MAPSDGDLGRVLVRLDEQQRSLGAELKQIDASIAALEVRRRKVKNSIDDLQNQSERAIREHSGKPHSGIIPVSLQSSLSPAVKSSRTPELSGPAIRASAVRQQDLSPLLERLLARSPDGAQGVRLQHSPNIIHQSFPTETFFDGAWHEISCHVCGANYRGQNKTYYRGTSGLRLHINSHFKGQTLPIAIFEQCDRRLVSTTDANRMLEGLKPADVAIVKKLPTDVLKEDPPTSQLATPIEDNEGVRSGEEMQPIHPDWPNVVFLKGQWTGVRCLECGANASINDRHFLNLTALHRHFSKAHWSVATTAVHYSTRVVSSVDSYLMQDGHYPLDCGIEMVASPTVTNTNWTTKKLPSLEDTPSSGDDEARLTEYEVYQNLKREAQASGSERPRRRPHKRKHWASDDDESYEKD